MTMTTPHFGTRDTKLYLDCATVRRLFFFFIFLFFYYLIYPKRKGWHQKARPAQVVIDMYSILMAANYPWRQSDSRQSSIFQGIGLPVPSGQHQVGCVDVMPLCKGDDSGLLFRLYYPTDATGFLLYRKFPYFAAAVLGPLSNLLLGNIRSRLRHCHLALF